MADGGQTRHPTGRVACAFQHRRIATAYGARGAAGASGAEAGRRVRVRPTGACAAGRSRLLHSRCRSPLTAHRAYFETGVRL